MKGPPRGAFPPPHPSLKEKRPQGGLSYDQLDHSEHLEAIFPPPHPRLKETISRGVFPTINLTIQNALGSYTTMYH